MDNNYLTLGVHVENGRVPPSYLKGRRAAGALPTDSDFLTVPSEAVAAHTAIIAQSGSGKSFFLGRLLEEIVTKTKARCLVLDPNGDFYRFDQVRWNDRGYDRRRHLGWLTRENSQEEFEEVWIKPPEISVRTARLGASEPPYTALSLSWQDLRMNVIASGLGPMVQEQIHDCHELARGLSYLMSLEKFVSRQERFPPSTSEDARVPMAELLQEVERCTEATEPFAVEERLQERVERIAEVLDERFREELGSAAESQLRYQAELIVSASKGVEKPVARYYLARGRELLRRKMLRDYSFVEEMLPSSSPRVEIIDLPSIQDRSIQLLAVSSILEQAWRRARSEWERAVAADRADDTRVPTFIVVDEAHNLMPLDSYGDQATEAVREQFRRIAAEGRKFGVFLIVVSQRPDKLDELVLSECMNKAIMKLETPAAVSRTREMLGLDHVALLQRCLSFRTGRVLLAGQWATEPRITYGAARRTVEGGKNLDSTYWATPFGAQPATRSHGTGTKPATGEKGTKRGSRSQAKRKK